jgi:hypothetical protein
MKIFLAGIMQGSFSGPGYHSQGYRQQLTELLHRNLSQVEIIDPWAMFPNSDTYSNDQARRTFFQVCDLVNQADLLIAYLPEASIGTGVEMWEAYRQGVPIITISPMEQNWAIQFLSWQVCQSMEELESLLQKETLPPLAAGECA